jgi:hypothetical protein
MIRSGCPGFRPAITVKESSVILTDSGGRQVLRKAGVDLGVGFEEPRTDKMIDRKSNNLVAL